MAPPDVRGLIHCLLRAYVLLPACLSLNDSSINRFMVSAFNTESFKNPNAAVRPRFRYWLPDASVDADVVAAGIAAAGAVGAGGIEFVPFYEYGGALGSMPAGANWSTFNFGTDPFRRLFLEALATHEQHGLVMDFALGPNQGQGVPADPEDPGLQWDLIPFTTVVSANGSFAGTVPGWGTGQLVSLTSALVVSNSTITYEGTGLAGTTNVTYDQYILAADSLLDHTNQVSQDGFASLTFVKTQAQQHYRLFAFFQKLSGNKNLEFASTVNNSIFDSGSYAVDHFDSRGAETIIAFWGKYILNDEVRDKLRKSGHYVWEDSLELVSNISWSRSIPTRFQDAFGYSIRPYLPLLAFQQNNLGVQPTEPGPFHCILDTEDHGIGYVNGFRATLVAGYQEYLLTLKRWVNDELGIQLSVQPAYGLPMDMEATIPEVDAPECESLTFLDLIDSYRQFSGPAELTGKRVISNELGAVRGSGFRYRIPELLFSANRGFAGGVNQYVIHGQIYTGEYYQTTWPGHTPFNYLFSEPWSGRQPVWDYGLKEALDYISRVQYLQQQGVSKVDVAIYNKESATTIRTVYADTDLVDAGWSYNYLTSDNLHHPQVTVEDGLLAPTGPSWKAFVVDSTANVSLDAIKSLQRLAEAGLPIILAGGPPNFYPTGRNSSLALFREHLKTLERWKNVHLAEEGQVANKLASLGLRPQVGVETNGTWYSTWRESTAGGDAMIYSDLAPSQGKVTIADTRTPFFLDPWSGKQTPVLIYEQQNDSTIIPLRLGGNQTLIIAFRKSKRCSDVPSYHVTSAPSSVIGSTFNPKEGIILHVAHTDESIEVSLSNGSTCGIAASSSPPTFELSKWRLVAEHWEAPSNISSATAPTTRRNTTHDLHSLIPWTEIPALVNTSGVGYYNSTFDWPPHRSANTTENLGAYISFDNVIHSLRVQINGQQLPPLDIMNAVADISPYLRHGTNNVTAIVPTTWWNYLRTILDVLRSAGSEPLPLVLQQYLGTPLPSADLAGLVAGVSIIPFREVVY